MSPISQAARHPVHTMTTHEFLGSHLTLQLPRPANNQEVCPKAILSCHVATLWKVTGKQHHQPDAHYVTCAGHEIVQPRAVAAEFSAEKVILLEV